MGGRCDHLHGNVAAVFAEDAFDAAPWLTLRGGLRVTRFSGGLTEKVVSPRFGATARLPWRSIVVRASYGDSVFVVEDKKDPSGNPVKAPDGKPAKKVITYAHDGSENGWLIELSKDGRKTTAYLTAASSGSFKGYHLHRVRAARYVCVRGRMKIIVYVDGKRQEHVLDAAAPQR